MLRLVLIVALLAPVGTGLAAAARGKGPARTPAPASAEELYRKADKYFREGKLQEAGWLSGRVRREHASHRLFWPASLMWARCATSVAEAERRFSLLAKDAPAGTRTECELELAYLKLAAGETGKAAAAFESWLKEHGSDERADEAAFWQGLSLKELGKKEEAAGVLAKLKRGGSHTSWRAQAGLLLAGIRFEKGDLAGAHAAYLELQGELWARDVRPQALLGAGRCALALKREAEGRGLLRKLVQEFPDLDEAVRAKNLLAGSEKDGQRFGVQVGAFSRRELAEKLKKDYARKGFACVIVERRTGSLSLHAVLVGPYPSRKEAGVAKDKIRKGGVEAFVTAF